MSLLASKPEDSLALLRRLGIGVPESGAPSAAPGGYSKGDVINGEYRVLDAKEGGFGRVYLCEDLEPERRARGNRLVALKTPLRLRLAKGTDIDLFYAEAANWISLGSHSNIVYAWGFVEIARMPFVAMEYIENAVTLADEIDAGRTDWRVALRIGLGVARGLAHAQAEASLVHGDVKPLNILITPAGAAKVTDFGLSLIDPGGDDPVDGAICGTRGYIAPEMHRGNSGRSQPADMFAFGVTLFQTVTRRWPFPPGGPGPGPASAPPDAREFTPQVPAEVALLIAECLRSAPALRPPSFASLAERLESLHRRLLRTGPSTDASPDAPPRSEALVNAASSWHNLGQWDKARGVAKQAIAADRTNWKAHTELGCIFVSARDYSEALACFKVAHRLASEKLITVANLAQTNYFLEDRTEAKRWFERALRMCEASGEFGRLDHLSLLVIEFLPFDDALRVCDAIIDDRPDAAVTWNQRAILLRRAGQPAAALESADRALEINPAYAKAHINRANALIELRRFPDALDAAARGLALNDKLAGGYAARATALAQTGRLDEARKCIAKGRLLLPDSELLLRASEVFARDPAPPGEERPDREAAWGRSSPVENILKTQSASRGRAGFLRRIFGAAPRDDSRGDPPTGVLLWFDWKTISETGSDSYGQYVYRAILPILAELCMSKGGKWTIFDGDCLVDGELRLPPCEEDELPCVERVRRLGPSRCYVVGMYGSSFYGALHDGLRVPASGSSGREPVVGYLGKTTFRSLDARAFVALTRRIALPVSMQIDDLKLVKISFEALADQEIRSFGFNVRRVSN